MSNTLKDESTARLLAKRADLLKMTNNPFGSAAMQQRAQRDLRAVNRQLAARGER